MAEAIAVFGALSSLLQIVDFASKVVCHTRELIASGKDTLQDYIDTERLARDYKWLGEHQTTLKEQHPIGKLGKACQDEANALLEELERLKIEQGLRGFRRARKSAQAVLRASRKRKQIDAHRRRLQELNGQLATALLKDAWEGHAKTGLIPAPHGIDSNNVVEVERIVRRSAIDHILTALRLPDISQRKRHIPKASPRTYEWAFNEEKFKLKPWLQSSIGLFWIQGKAGSGKSTLMKFLSDHQQTRGLLETWSESNPLSIASFFFWYPGTTEQKTIPGLLRSILYELLFDSPELGAIAFPDFLQRTIPSAGGLHFTHEELVAAVCALAEHDPLHNPRKYCLFIDGLDEYPGDHLELTALITKLARNKHVKICASSRPWNAFRRTFEKSVPNLRLEDISKPDIVRYVQDSLHDVCNLQSPAAMALINEIVGRAEGVFLWVYMVVRLVRRGYAEDDDLVMLKHRVASFPSDLEDFFRNTLTRVDSVYAAQTRQALKLAWLYVQNEHKVHDLQSFLDYWLIMQSPHGLADPGFANELEPTDLTCTSAQAMVVRTRAFLCASCKDLLCIPDDVSLDKHSKYPKVQFLHRTVYDWLGMGDMQTMLNEQIPEHFVASTICDYLNLARVNFSPSGDDVGSWSVLLERTVASTSKVPGYHKAIAAAAFRHQKYLWGPDEKSTLIEETCRMMTEMTAFCENRYVAIAVDEYAKQLDSLPSSNESDISRNRDTEMVLACLGEHPLHQFPVEDISKDLIAALSKNGMLIYDSASYGPCSTTLWQRFLRRWALSETLNPNTEDLAARTVLLRRVWDVAKLLLASGAILSESFCINPNPADNKQHRDVACSSAEFLEQRVPQEWLRESAECMSLLQRT